MTERIGVRQATVPTLAVVETNESANLTVEGLLEVDQRAVGRADRATQA